MKAYEKPLTPEVIGDWVQHIENLADDNDYEAAHHEEREVWETVLFALGRRECEDPSLCAFVAAKSRELGFPRW